MVCLLLDHLTSLRADLLEYHQTRHPALPVIFQQANHLVSLQVSLLVSLLASRAANRVVSPQVSPLSDHLVCLLINRHHLRAVSRLRLRAISHLAIPLNCPRVNRQVNPPQIRQRFRL